MFDVDRMLADTECDGHRVAFNEAFAEAGLGLALGCGVIREAAGGTGSALVLDQFGEPQQPRSVSWGRVRH
jgi:hypothetical protein